MNEIMKNSDHLSGRDFLFLLNHVYLLEFYAEINFLQVQCLIKRKCRLALHLCRESFRSSLEFYVGMEILNAKWFRDEIIIVKQI
jgi:hypothetical protein